MSAPFIRRIYLATFILIVSSFACLSQNLKTDLLLDKPFALQASVVDSIDATFRTDLSDILKQYAAAETWALDHSDKKLVATFRMFESWHKLIAAFKTPEREKTEEAFLSLSAKFNSSEFTPLKTLYLNKLADYYWAFVSDYKRSFELELKNYELYKPLDYKDCPLKTKYLYQLASRYYGFKDYRTATNILLEVSDESAIDSWAPGSDVYYNLLGLSYRHSAMYDSAEYYFKAGLRKARLKGSKIYEAIIQGNIGINYYYQKKFDEAIPLLKRDIDYCLENNRASDNATKSMAVLADVYLQKGNISEARSLIDKAYEVIEREGYRGENELCEFVYPVIAKVAASQGNFSKAYIYQDSATLIHATLEKQKNALMLSGVQNVVSAQLHMAELDRLNEQKSFQVLLRNVLIGGVLLLGALALIIINRQTIVNRRKQEKLEAEKQLVASELNNAAEQLHLFTRSIQEKNALIEEFSTQLESLQPSSVGIAENYEPETLLKLRESTILTDEEWENFRKLFERVHGDYLERVKMKIPGLSPAETRFITLAKLQFSNKEMAGILGISTDAVRMNKHRLRKKLNLTDDVTIEELVASL
jgi:tetratricopeptide (TPR) repeat protein